MKLEELDKPFPSNDIEWRVSRSGEKNSRPWALVLAYVTNRAIMERLDGVCGKENWKNVYTQAPSGGVLCGISILINDEWITKWDGAENTQYEAVKGGLSAAMKRAAVQWGIGRYLYNLPAKFAEIDDNGNHRDYYQKDGKKIWFKWNPPMLPDWALGELPKEEATF